MLFLRVEAVVRADRNEALMNAADAINGCGGWIVDHTMFSDVMAVVNFAVPADRTGAVGKAFTDAGIAVTPTPPEVMGSAEQEVFGQLTLTFPNGTGDLRRSVPAFQ